MATVGTGNIHASGTGNFEGITLEQLQELFAEFKDVEFVQGCWIAENGQTPAVQVWQQPFNGELSILGVFDYQAQPIAGEGVFSTDCCKVKGIAFEWLEYVGTEPFECGNGGGEPCEGDLSLSVETKKIEYCIANVRATGEIEYPDNETRAFAQIEYDILIDGVVSQTLDLLHPFRVKPTGLAGQANQVPFFVNGFYFDNITILNPNTTIDLSSIVFDGVNDTAFYAAVKAAIEAGLIAAGLPVSEMPVIIVSGSIPAGTAGITFERVNNSNFCHTTSFTNLGEYYSNLVNGLMPLRFFNVAPSTGDNLIQYETPCGIIGLFLDFDYVQNTHISGDSLYTPCDNVVLPRDINALFEVLESPDFPSCQTCETISITATYTGSDSVSYFWDIGTGVTVLGGEPNGATTEIFVSPDSSGVVTVTVLREGCPPLVQFINVGDTDTGGDGGSTGDGGGAGGGKRVALTETKEDCGCSKSKSILSRELPNNVYRVATIYYCDGTFKTYVVDWCGTQICEIPCESKDFVPYNPSADLLQQINDSINGLNLNIDLEPIITVNTEGFEALENRLENISTSLTANTAAITDMQTAIINAINMPKVVQVDKCCTYEGNATIVRWYSDGTAQYYNGVEWLPITDFSLLVCSCGGDSNVDDMAKITSKTTVVSRSTTSTNRSYYNAFYTGSTDLIDYGNGSTLQLRIVPVVRVTNTAVTGEIILQQRPHGSPTTSFTDVATVGFGGAGTVVNNDYNVKGVWVNTLANHEYRWVIRRSSRDNGRVYIRHNSQIQFKTV